MNARKKASRNLLRKHIDEKRLADFMKRRHDFRDVLFDEMLRALMVASSGEPQDGGKPDWDRVCAEDIAGPVTIEVLSQWLKSGPSRSALYYLTGLFDPFLEPVDDRLCYEDLLACVEEEASELLPLVMPFSAVSRCPAAFAFARKPGKLLGESAAKSKTSSGQLLHNIIALGTIEAVGAYLRDGVDKIGALELSRLSAVIADDAPQWVQKAYGEACIRALSKLEDESYHAHIKTNLMSAEQIFSVLKNATEQPVNFQNLAYQTAVQNRSQGATALARMMNDSDIGHIASCWLATMGEQAHTAARIAWSDEALQEDDLLNERVEKLLRLPLRVTAHVGTAFDGHRYGCDLRRFLLEPGAPGEPMKEPIDLQKLLDHIGPDADPYIGTQVRDVRKYFTSEEWADYLQIRSIDPNLLGIKGSWHIAKKHGLLGRGSERHSLIAAIDRLDWSGRISHRIRGSRGPGLGHILLWAGADREVFLHAIVRAKESMPFATVMGFWQTNFLNALDTESPRWMTGVLPLVEWLNGLYSRVTMNPETPPGFAFPPIVEELPVGPISHCRIKDPPRDFWLNLELEDVETLRIEMRGTAVVEVDRSKKLWKYNCPKTSKSGAIPLVQEPGLTVHLELFRGQLSLGFQGVPALTTAAIPFDEVTDIIIEAPGATLNKGTVHQKFSANCSSRIFHAIATPEEGQSLAEIAAYDDEPVANVYAAIATFFEEPVAEKARTFLSRLGEDAHPFQRALGVGEPQPQRPFAIRSWQEVKAALDRLRPGELLIEDFFDELRAASYSDLNSPEMVSAVAVPWPTVYLEEDRDLPEKEGQIFRKLVSFPALTRGQGGEYRSVDFYDGGRYKLMRFLMHPAERSFMTEDEALIYVIYGAVWEVSEGIAWSIWEEHLSDLAAIVGIESIPIADWKRTLMQGRIGSAFT